MLGDLVIKLLFVVFHSVDFADEVNPNDLVLFVEFC